MDKDQLALAIQGLGIYSHELSPAYQTVRERLAGSLAINGLMIDELRFQRESIKPNENLVNDFLDLLPVADQASTQNNGWFRIGNAYTARMIEANTAWIPEALRGDTKDSPTIPVTKLQPFYIIGERPSSQHANVTELLLAPTNYEARDSAGYKRARRDSWVDFKTAAVWTDEKEAAEKLIEERVTTEYSEKDIELMFDGFRGLFLRAEQVAGFVQRPFSRKRPSLFKPFDLFQTVCNVGGINISAAVNLRDQLTNDILAQFGVMDRLNRLAVAFDKIEELTALLKQQQADAPTNPLDKYFNSEESA